MSLSARALKRRIRTVANTGKMAKAMKAVSVSKLRQTEAAMESWRAYVEILDDAMKRVVSSGQAVDHPLLHPREEQEPVLAVIVSSDRGLCGSYNARVLERFDRFLSKHADIQVCPLGRKADRYYARRGREPFPFTREHGGRPSAELSHALANFLLDQFQTGKCNRVVFVYNHFVNVMRYETVERQFLPVELTALEALDESKETEKLPEKVIFEPEPGKLASALLERWLRARVHGWLSDAFSAEHAARMMAMSDAFENCEELFYKLTLQMNKARQAAITKELLEIVAGAEALRGGKG